MAKHLFTISIVELQVTLGRSIILSFSTGVSKLTLPEARTAPFPTEEASTWARNCEENQN